MFPQCRKIIKFINGLECVRRFRSVVRIGVLAPQGHHRPGMSSVHSVKHIINQVYAPVSHQTTGIIPKPTEIEVQAVRVERPFSCWPEPHFIIHTGGTWLVLLTRYPFYPPTVG